METNPMLNAAEAVLDALRTGEYSAARRAIACLADEPRFIGNTRELHGRDAVADRLTGQWGLTPVLSAGVFEIGLDAEGRTATIAGRFPGKGAAPEGYRVTLEFDAAGRIAAIHERYAFPAAPPAQAEMPGIVRRAIDRALVEGKPLTVGFTRPDGSPSLSLRGSVQTWGGGALILWLRNARGGLAQAIRDGRRIALLYRDSATRTTLTIEAAGRITDDADERRRIFERTPETEQRHDPQMTGAAAVLDIIRLSGTTPEGPVLVVRPD